MSIGCGWIGYWLPAHTLIRKVGPALASEQDGSWQFKAFKAHNCDQYLLNLFALASPFDSRETSWSILHVTHLI